MGIDSNTVTGSVQVFTATILHIIGTVYKDAYLAIKEYPENGRDAGATQFFIYIDENWIIFEDNGKGFLPFMTEQGRAVIKNYRRHMKEGGRMGDIDVRSQLDAHSLSSLEWLGECVGFSSKDPDNPNTIGMLGIGAWALYRFGTGAVLHSRPSPELWGSNRLAPVSEFVFPNSDTEQYKITPNIGEFRNHLGIPTNSHGTVIKVRRKPGVEITPDRLNKRLQSVFEDDMIDRSGHFNIVIVDKLTAAGKREKEGIKTPVTFAIKYPGHILHTANYVLVRDAKAPKDNGYEFVLDKEIEDSDLETREDGKQFLSIPSPNGKPQEDLTFEVFPNITFGIFTHYTTSGDGLGLKIRRKTAYRPVSDIKDLATAPFTDPGLSGYISLPHIPGREGLLLSHATKDFPLDSPIMAAWLVSCKQIGLELESRIEKRRANEEQGAFEQKTKQLTPMLGEAIQKAVKSMAEFTGGSLGGVKSDSAKSPKTEKKPKISSTGRTIAWVLNEISNRVDGVVIRVSYWRNGLQVRDKIYQGESVNGFVDFGHLPPCHKDSYYVAEVVTDDGVFVDPEKFFKIPRSASTYTFEIAKEGEGVELVFRVNQGFTLVKIFDEHNRGVSGVDVRIFRMVNGKPRGSAAYTTEKGLIDLGELDFNDADNEQDYYVVRILIDQGVFERKGYKLVEGIFEQTFRLSREKPGFNAIFHIQTGEDPPLSAMGRVGTKLAPYQDPNVPWINMLHAGFVQINTEFPPLYEALIDEDYEVLLPLLAEFGAAAIIDEMQKKDVLAASEVAIVRSLLFTTTLQNMRQIRLTQSAKRKRKQQ